LATVGGSLYLSPSASLAESLFLSQLVACHFIKTNLWHFHLLLQPTHLQRVFHRQFSTWSAIATATSTSISNVASASTWASSMRSPKIFYLWVVYCVCVCIVRCLLYVICWLDFRLWHRLVASSFLKVNLKYFLDYVQPRDCGSQSTWGGCTQGKANRIRIFNAM